METWDPPLSPSNLTPMSPYLRIIPLLVGLLFTVLAVAGALATIANYSCLDHEAAIVCTGSSD